MSEIAKKLFYNNGSITNDGFNTYAFNTDGRLFSSTDSQTTPVTTTYLYNGLNQRIKKNNSTTTYFVYDQWGHILGEYDQNGNAIQEIIWIGNIPISVIKNSNLYALHADHLNTPRQIDNNSGNPVWNWSTMTFGSSNPNEDPMNSGLTFNYNLRHAGQYFDKESGLFQNYYRDYNPNLGRYIEADPIGLNGGNNRFAYVGNNPISYNDMFGLLDVLVKTYNTGGGFSLFKQPGHAQIDDLNNNNMISMGPTDGSGFDLHPMSDFKENVDDPNSLDATHIYEIHIDDKYEADFYKSLAQEKNKAYNILAQFTGFGTTCITSVKRILVKSHVPLLEIAPYMGSLDTPSTFTTQLEYNAQTGNPNVKKIR